MKNSLNSKLDDRSKAIIERIEKDLQNDGHTRNIIKECCKESLIQLDSYFDMLVDLKLNGQKELSNQELWENIKAYTNELESLIRGVSKDYRNLEIKYKGLQKDYEEVIREKK